MNTETTEPKYVYVVVTGAAVHSKECDTEAEAQSVANCMRDREPDDYRDVEVERRQHVGRGYKAWLRREGEWRHVHHVQAGLTRDEIRAREEEEAQKPRPVGPQLYIGTFNGNHFHPITGQNLKFARVQFQAASRDDANDLMWDAFGDEGWWDAHPLEDVRSRFRAGGKTPDEIDAVLWGAPYFRVGWPPPPVPPGETVTLRLRLTPALAAESAVWLAGRCILHRPAPNCVVQYGAGVWPEDGEYPDAWSPDDEPGVGGIGLVLLVKYFKRADAERAVASDPENISIVEGSESFGTFRRPPKVFKDEPAPSKNKVIVSGVFSIDALGSLAEAEESFGPVYAAAYEALEATAADTRAYAVELVNNKIVAVHVTPKGVL